MIIADLEVKLKAAEDNPKAFFGDNIAETLKEMQGKSHPDRFATDADKRRADEIFRAFGLAAEKAKEPPIIITTKTRSYTATGIRLKSKRSQEQALHPMST